MATREQIEKVRQEIMRFRELLNLMEQSVRTGNGFYNKLFAGFTAEEIAATKEKDLQWKLAEQIVDDTSDLGKAVVRMRFEARNFERDFEQLYNIIMTVEEEAE